MRSMRPATQPSRLRASSASGSVRRLGIEAIGDRQRRGAQCRRMHRAAPERAERRAIARFVPISRGARMNRQV